MNLTNKEIIQKLTKYFLKENPEKIARLLANMIIDMNRIVYLDDLPSNEQQSLFERMKANSDELNDFINSTQLESLKIYNLEEKYENNK